MKTVSPPIEIFTDGSSRGNPGPGGCAAILKYKGNIKEISEGYSISTNNRMELMAIILALESIKIVPSNIIIYTDSQYIVNTINRGWLENWIKIDFKKKKNKDLWIRFYSLYIKHSIKIVWVRGHSGHKENERCHNLALASTKKLILKEDLGYRLNG